MTNEALQNLINSWIPDLEFSEEESQFLNITVTPENLHQLAIRCVVSPPSIQLGRYG